MRNLRIVFFGTPEFAVASLRILHENNFEIAAVVTAPDRPKGRGKVLLASEVKKYAESANLNILQPTNLKSEEFLEDLKELNANLFVVVAFRMLPREVWQMPEYGTFNLHGSLLPEYRGAAPINWAIINGESRTGVTTFFLKHEIDTGNVILQAEEPIHPTDDAGTLYVRLMEKGARLVLETVKLIEEGEPETMEQTQGTEKHAPKIFRETCEIDWERDSKDIVNFIRGLSPYPGAWTKWNNMTYKVFEAMVTDMKLEPGEYRVSEGQLIVGTGNGSVSILQLQAEGKRRMQTVDYLKGNSI